MGGDVAVADGGPPAEVLEHSWDWAGSPGGEQPEPVSWPEAARRLAAADTYWLATVRPDGRPHAVPVLAVWADDALHFCASPRSRKARNLATHPACVVTAQVDGLDLSLEGEVRVRDEEAVVRQVADAYREKYGWDPAVREGKLWAGGAPTAGPPPYVVYRVEARLGLGFPTDETATPTRWRFGP